MSRVGTRAFPYRVVLLLVLALLLVGYFGSHAPGTAVDEAMKANRAVSTFAARDDHYFDAMDGGLQLTPEQRKGRITWLLWTGGNDSFWDVLARSLDSIIAALSARFDVRLKSPLAANDRVTRSYTGSLHSIMRRLLDGCDFVIATRQNGSVESITVFRRSHTGAADSLPVFWTRIEPRGTLGFAN